MELDEVAGRIAEEGRTAGADGRGVRALHAPRRRSSHRLSLLLVALHHRLVAHGRPGRVLTGVLAGPALAQEIPALVQAHLELLQPPLVRVAQGVGARSMGTEAVLLLDQPV